MAASWHLIHHDRRVVHCPAPRLHVPILVDTLPSPPSLPRPLSALPEPSRVRAISRPGKKADPCRLLTYLAPRIAVMLHDLDAKPTVSTPFCTVRKRRKKATSSKNETFWVSDPGFLASSTPRHPSSPRPHTSASCSHGNRMAVQRRTPVFPDLLYK
ncbi:hypothetical protein LX36DRAFT_329587 [Colletotrichum falcatum]|nr:hypothetical protein LX36DRAFT_329587 [Colletotrichum falcatum]